MTYKCEASTVEGFVQQLAVAYLTHGYWFYTLGTVPERKDPKRIDAKLIEKYGVDISRASRCRRKRGGLANIHYLRYDRFFVLLATHGKHLFFEEEGERVKDARRSPIKFQGYSVGHNQGHPRVAIEREVYQGLKAELLELATRCSRKELEAAFWNMPWEPYAPIRSQILTLFRQVNAKREIAGLGPLQRSCLRLYRKQCRPFEIVSPQVLAA